MESVKIAWAGFKNGIKGKKIITDAGAMVLALGVAYELMISNSNKLEEFLQFNNSSKDIFSTEKPIRCRKCAKQFTDKTDLKQHECPKMQIRRFECELCFTSFNTEKVLRKHSRIHLPFVDKALSLEASDPRRKRVSAWIEKYSSPSTGFAIERLKKVTPS